MGNGTLTSPYQCPELELKAARLMKRQTRFTYTRFLGVVTLAVLLLQGARAQEVITDPVLEFGYGRLDGFAVCPDGEHFFACTAGSFTSRTFLFDLTNSERGRLIDFEMPPAEDGGGGAWSMAVSPDGGLLASIVWKRGDFPFALIAIHDLASQELIQTIDTGITGCTVLTFSPDSERILFAGHGERSVYLFDVESGQVVREFEHPGTVGSAAISPDGNQVLIGGRRDNSVAYLWDVSTGEAVQGYPFLQAGVAVAFSPDGEELLMGNDSVYVYESASGQLSRKLHFPVPDGECASVSVSSDGSMILASVAVDGQGDVTGLWDAESAQLLGTFEGTLGAFVLNGQAMLTQVNTSNEEHGLRLYDVESGQVVRSWQEFLPEVYDLSFSADGTLLMATVGGNSCGIWDVNSGELIRRLKHPGGGDGWASLSADTTQVVMAGGVFADGLRMDVNVYDLASGECLRTFQPEIDPWVAGMANAVAFSSDFTMMGIGTSPFDESTQEVSGLLAVCDLSTGSLHRSFVVEADPALLTIGVCPVTFSPDGRYVAAGIDLYPVDPPRHRIDMWDIQTGTLVHRFETTDSIGVNNLSFSADGSRLLSASGCCDDERYAFLWDTSSGQLLRRFHTPADGAALSPDGATVITETETAFELWDAETGHLSTTLLRNPAVPFDSRGSAGPIAFSPNGRSVATFSAWGTPLLWNLVPEIRLNGSRGPSDTFVLTWQDPADGSPYILQQRTDLSTPDWTEVTVSTPGRHEVASPSEQTMFYRLHSP